VRHEQRSSERYFRAASCTTREEGLGELAIAVGHAAWTSSMKNTTACSAG